MSQNDSIPASALSLGDYERHAFEHMDPLAWAYLCGGAGDEVTLRENIQAYEQCALEPRVLCSFDQADTSCRIHDRTYTHPVFLAPVAYHRLFHPEGETATVRGAAAIEAGAIISCQSSVSLESLAEEAGSPLWWQLYFQPNRQDTLDLVRRAEAAGYEALVLTVDAPVSGIRDRERRFGFHLPPGISAVNLVDQPVPFSAEVGDHGSPLLLGRVPRIPTWEDVAWLKSQTRLPVWLKGILSPRDAKLAVEASVDGIIVSNHGGRTLDTSLPTFVALPRIARAVNGAVPILVDGGIRRGTDVLKALALGASAVMVGRPYIHGLAVAGALGVAHVLQLLRVELEVAMILSGCNDLSRIDPDLVLPRALAAGYEGTPA